ncbi:SGNH/GDSL hydrolase family protein [Campylobacter upsaliensis]
MKNVILLGGSNSVVQNGLQKGLKDTLMSCGGGGVEFHNLALGGSRSSQKIYSLIANKKVIEEADLIIIETNLNEYDNFIYDLHFDILQRDFEILCKMLANLNKPILFYFTSSPCQ